MSNQIDLFYRGTDSNYYYRNWDGAKWTPADSWENIGGGVRFVSEPVAIRWGDNLIYLYGIDIEGKLRLAIRNREKGTWDNAWGTLSGNGTAKKWASKPTVAAVYGEWMAATVMAADNTPYIIMWLKGGQGWGEFESLGGSFKEVSSLISWGGRRADVFGLGLDGNVYHKWWEEGKGWLPNRREGNWEELYGPFQNSPQAATWGKDRLDLVGVGRGGVLRHNFWDGKTWSGWNAVEGVSSLIGRPEGVSWGVNRLHVFAIGDDRAVHHKWYDGSCNRWEPSSYDENLGGKVFGEQVTAVTPSTNRLDVFYVGTDAVVYQKTCVAKTGWTPSGDTYKSLGGNAASRVQAYS